MLRYLGAVAISVTATRAQQPGSGLTMTVLPLKGRSLCAVGSVRLGSTRAERQPVGDNSKKLEVINMKSFIIARNATEGRVGTFL